jgi:hypothetical protein
LYSLKTHVNFYTRADDADCIAYAKYVTEGVDNTKYEYLPYLCKKAKRMKPMRKLILVSIILLAAYTTPVSAEVGDLLMSTGYKSLGVGESWSLEEGYGLTITQISKDGTKIWLVLLKYNSEVDNEVLSSGDAYVYEKEIGSKEYTILRATVGEIDDGSRTVRLDSVGQYSDGGAAVAPTTSTKADAVPMAQKTLPTSGSSGNIPKLIFPSNGDIMNDGRVGNQVWDFDWTDVEGASEYLERLNTSLTLSQVFHRLNTSLTLLKIRASKSRDASDDVSWRNQTNRTRKMNRSASMRSIDIREVNAPLKSAKVLVDRGYGCESGSKDTTISRKAVTRSGLGMNPEHRRMFAERQIRRWNSLW